MNKPRIASFLPSATEMACALGLADHLVGVSHECDYPPEAREKPVVVRCALDLTSLDLQQVDQTVSRRVESGGSVYAVDEEALRKAAPNLILTQDLCQVCAPSGNEATRVLESLSPKPDILRQTPHSFEDVLKDLLALGDKTGTREKAEELAKDARDRIERVRAATTGLPKARVFFMEWVDPVYCGGHWVPEMIGWAGGSDRIAKPNADSVRVPWEEVVRYDPEVLVVSPCGFGTVDALKQARTLESRPGWEGLSAVRKGRVFAVDANAYFARPGLRLVTGVEILAHLFHPEARPWTGPEGAFTNVPLWPLSLLH